MSDWAFGLWTGCLPGNRAEARRRRIMGLWLRRLLTALTWLGREPRVRRAAGHSSSSGSKLRKFSEWTKPPVEIAGFFLFRVAAQSAAPWTSRRALAVQATMFLTLGSPGTSWHPRTFNCTLLRTTIDALLRDSGARKGLRRVEVFVCVCVCVFDLGGICGCLQGRLHAPRCR